MTDSSTNGSASMGGAVEFQHAPGGGTDAEVATMHPDHYSTKPQAADILAAVVAKFPGTWTRSESAAADGSQLVRFTHESSNGDRISGNGDTNMTAAVNLQTRMEAING